MIVSTQDVVATLSVNTHFKEKKRIMNDVPETEVMNRLELKEYKSELPALSTPPNRSWYLKRCLICSCLCCFSEYPVLVSCMDLFAKLTFERNGLYPGGQFQREKFEKSMPKSKPGYDRLTNVISYEKEFPSRFEIGYNLKARIFSGKGVNSKTPVVVNIHGGGWVLNHIDDATLQYFCNSLAAKGFIVVSIEYRLAPEHKFPTAVFDCYEAIEWVFSSQEHLPQYADLSDGIILMGDSAGGNLAMVVATLIRDKLAPDLKPYEIPSCKISQLVLIYPYLCMDRFVKEEFNQHAPVLSVDTLQFFCESYFGSWSDFYSIARKNRRACPLLAGVERLPKTILISAGHDNLRFENFLLAEQYRLTKTPLIHRHYETEIHGFLVAPFGTKMRSALDQLVKDMKS